MIYQNIVPATFLRRPNRFHAICLLNDEEVSVHVRNTGRCRELLIPGVAVFLERADKPQRKTGYTLIAVVKGSRIINIDSLAPNRVLAEAILAGRVKLGDHHPQAQIVREVSYGSSRFDLAYKHKDTWQSYIEIKGVTLENQGIALFPDAPTERGVRHLNELAHIRHQGLGAHVVFVIQMENVLCFTPNDAMHHRFGEALREAWRAGVGVHAFACHVTADEITLGDPVPVLLNE